MYLSTDGYQFWRDRKNGVVFATPRPPTEPEIWLSFYEEVSLFCHDGSQVVFASPRPVDKLVLQDWMRNGVAEVSWDVYQLRREQGWASCDTWGTPRVRRGALENFYESRRRFLALV